jgi:hypothetical protein
MHRPRKPKEMAKPKHLGQEAGAPSLNPPESLSPAQSSPGAKNKGKLPAKTHRAGRPKY